MCLFFSHQLNLCTLFRKFVFPKKIEIKCCMCEVCSLRQFCSWSGPVSSHLSGNRYCGLYERAQSVKLNVRECNIYHHVKYLAQSATIKYLLIGKPMKASWYIMCLHQDLKKTRESLIVSQRDTMLKNRPNNSFANYIWHSRLMIYSNEDWCRKLEDELNDFGNFWSN